MNDCLVEHAGEKTDIICFVGIQIMQIRLRKLKAKGKNKERKLSLE